MRNPLFVLTIERERADTMIMFLFCSVTHVYSSQKMSVPISFLSSRKQELSIALFYLTNIIIRGCRKRTNMCIKSHRLIWRLLARPALRQSTVIYYLFSI